MGGNQGADMQLPYCRKERTPPEVREQRERERELRELDRDIRTVFAFNPAPQGRRAQPV